MERLVPVFKSQSKDVAVGISGFGSATVPASRWHSLGVLTGRDTFSLYYDAQEFPFEGPISNFDFSMVPEFYRRWDLARKGAEQAIDYLEKWLVRWTSQGRRVLLVGFSLGAMIAWRAAQRVRSPLIDVIFISGAMGDKKREFAGIGEIGRVLNLFSTEDLALRLLYPTGVGEDETPAVGLGPLVISGLENVTEIDVTDLVGWDHLWASEHLADLTRIAVGSWLSHEPVALKEHVSCDALDDEAVNRLYHYAFLDISLCRDFALALDGDPSACSRLSSFDLSSRQDWPLLFEIGDVGMILLSSSSLGPISARASARSLRSLRGVFRRFVSSIPDPTHSS